jgi:hypothetical protein
MQTVKGLSMEKRLCWGAMGVSGGLLLLFLLDLILLFVAKTSPGVAAFLPFGGISIFMDIIGILACGLVLYVAWDAYKEVR